MSRLLRHPSISARDRRAAATQNAENARDANEAIGARVAGRLWTVENFAATGSTSNKIPIADQAFRPSAIIVVRIYPSFDPSAALAAVPIINFYQDLTGIGVYEPSGLTANTQYTITFLILE